VGTALARKQGFFELGIFVLALLTTIGFQVTSNFANDYGDGVKGTDNEDRIGPPRALQSGLLSRPVLKRGIIISSFISMVLALALIYLAFGTDNWIYVLLFFLLGALSIWAALKYTIGSNAYGYLGLGDVFVFLFFGLLGVLGSMFLYTKSLDWASLLPAVSIGLLCVGVLNLNNLRDVFSDKKSGKNTIVVKMGFANGKLYHFALLSFALLCFIAYIWIERVPLFNAYFMLAFLPILIHLGTVLKTQEPGKLDGELKKLALSTFALAILFYIAINNFL
jgi:1,4-dihydroxy-2-naphthoate octaprenyltransferase